MHRGQVYDDLPAVLRGSVFTHQMAVRAGVTPRRLGLLQRAGVVRHLWHGVWCDSALPPDELTLLQGLRRVAPYVVASHATAGRLHGAEPGDDRLHVTVPESAPLRSAVGLVVHRDRLPISQVVVRHGFAVTDPYRTAIDLARSVRRRGVVEAVVLLDALLWAEAVEHQHLRARLAATPSGRGIAIARFAVDLARYGAASPGETRLRLVLAAGGVSEPRLQHRIRCGSALVVADLCWPRERLVVEYDGFGPHTERGTFERDRRRWSWLRAAGWELRAYTAESVRDRPVAIAAEVTSLLCRPSAAA